MPYREGDPTYELEGKTVNQTLKAYLVDITLVGEQWIPKSQVVSVSDPDVKGNRDWVVTEWWARQAGLI